MVSVTMLGCLLLVLNMGTLVYSIFDLPCMTPLGLKYGTSDHTLTFDLAMSSGEPDSIRLNGPKAWRPSSTSESFVQINISEPVLLTALQTQGDPHLIGQVTGWLLDTSFDCETYKTEAYSLDLVNTIQTQTVFLKSIEFVTCIRLRPTHFKGKAPALRLELLGCTVQDNSVCDRDSYPVAEIWLENGGRQLNFKHEIVISWIKILVDLHAHGDSGDAGIFYSKSCDQWMYYEPSEINIISVMSSDQKSSWITLEMDTPVRAKCLRIFPPLETDLKEIHTSTCRSHVSTSLLNLKTDKTVSKDALIGDTMAYQGDTPNISQDAEPTDQKFDTEKLTQDLKEHGKPELSRGKVEENPQTKNNVIADEVLEKYIKPGNTKTGTEILAEGTSSPVTEATSSLVTEATSSPVTEATSSPVTEATFSPVTEAASSPVTEATSSLVTEATSSPVTEATFSPVTEATFSPVTEATFSPVTEATFSPVTEAASLPQTKSTSPPQTDATSSPVTEAAASPQTEATSLSVTEPTSSPATEAAASPQTEATSLSVTEPTSSPVTEPSPTPQTEAGAASPRSETTSSQLTEGASSQPVTETEVSTTLETKNANNQAAAKLHTRESTSQVATFSTLAAILLKNKETNKMYVGVPDSQTYQQENYKHSSYPSVAVKTLNAQPFSPKETNISSENPTAAFDLSLPASTENYTIFNSTGDNRNEYPAESGTDRIVTSSFGDRSADTTENVNKVVTTTEAVLDTIQQSVNTTTLRSSELGMLSGNGSLTGISKSSQSQSECGVKGFTKRIRKKRVTSGEVNLPGEWPWLVSMHFLPETHFTSKSGFKHLCGASLIAPDWILTAAHCFAEDVIPGLSNLTGWRIYFGMHDVAREENHNFVQERLIEAVYWHPDYNISKELFVYDVALVKLNESVELNEQVSPICLDESDRHYKESECFVTGWGQITPDSPGSRFPHTAMLSTMTLSSCKDKYDALPDGHPIKKFVHIVTPILCATGGTTGEDACQGDSGGPLMCEHDGRWYQAGIIAAGYLCGNEETPGLYSRVSYFIEWIRNTMEGIGDL